MRNVRETIAHEFCRLLTKDSALAILHDTHHVPQIAPNLTPHESPRSLASFNFLDLVAEEKRRRKRYFLQAWDSASKRTLLS